MSPALEGKKSENQSKLSFLQTLTADSISTTQPENTPNVVVRSSKKKNAGKMLTARENQSDRFKESDTESEYVTALHKQMQESRPAEVYCVPTQ